jgi:hypothetical protein
MTRAVLISPVAHQVDAESLASQYPGGAGSFGPGASRWSTAPGTPVANATDLAISGDMDYDMIEAFRADARFIVIDNPDDGPVVPLMLALDPPRHKCVESEEV